MGTPIARCRSGPTEPGALAGPDAPAASGPAEYAEERVGIEEGPAYAAGEPCPAWLYEEYEDLGLVLSEVGLMARGGGPVDARRPGCWTGGVGAEKP